MSILVLFRTGRVSQCLLLAVLAGSTLLVEGAGVFYARGQTSQTVPSDLTPQPGQIAPLLQGLGDHHHPVTTRSPRTQRFFDQGLRLKFAFNHPEAVRAFREAARLDPNCAMAYWGLALVRGPNINASMEEDSHREAYQAIQKALSLKSQVSEVERAYIEALSKRYSNEKGADRKALDRAYAGAMRELSKRYPDDADAATLYAAALMNLRPWNYWGRDGRPYAGTMEFVSTLESVLEREPLHPGANHYYIHAVEATATPQRALRSAERLGKLMPGAGHLVHMPAHIYLRVGRYAAASESNVRAIEADEDYITQCRVQSLYPLQYYPHNIHFLWASATMEGRSAVAIRSARQVASKVPPVNAKGLLPFGKVFPLIPLFALTRFGQWEAILTEPVPPPITPLATGLWHYARGMAFTRTGKFEEASGELEKLSAILQDSTAVNSPVGSTTAANILRIATEVLAGELAAEQDEVEKALGHLHAAVLLEDSLPYTEPADWHYPVRQSLGAVLLKAGRAVEAEVVYWEDLRRNPENGWSLFGLAQSLRAQGKDEEAGEVEKRFQKAWARADVTLTSSRF